MIDLSVIVPVFNEEDAIVGMAEGLAPALDRYVGAGQWQFVFIDNGSTDRTPTLLNDLCRRWPASKIINLDRPDYGNALASGLKAAEGDWCYIINVDFWDSVFLAWSWQHRKDYDLIIGSKRADMTLNKQPRYRIILSWGLNTILQFIFGFVGTDTHGQKFLKMPTMRPILEKTVMRRGQFDTEFTLRTIRGGLWLAEVPVPIVEERRQRNLMLRKIYNNLCDIVRLRRIIHQVPYKGPIRYHRWAREDMLAAAKVAEATEKDRVIP